MISIYRKNVEKNIREMTIHCQLHMNLSRLRTKTAMIFIVIIIVVAGIAGGSFLNLQLSSDSVENNAELSGYLYDSQTGIGLIDEVCVILDKVNSSSFEIQRFWPGDPDNRGYYNFSDLGPGTYSISLARSWVRYSLGDDEPEDYSWVGWDLSNRYYIDVNPGESVSYDIYLDFFCDKTWIGSIDNLRFFGSSTYVLGWGSDGNTNWFGNNTNLIGKEMTISVEWENTALTRTDFTIEICDLESSDEVNYEAGSQKESITWDLTADFFLYIQTCGYRDWIVSYNTFASIETKDIMYTIQWVIE